MLSKTVKLDVPMKRLFGIASDVTEDATGDALFIAAGDKVFQFPLFGISL